MKYIDLHIHGGFGTDLMKADAEKINDLSVNLKKQDVCAWMPTLIGDRLDILEERVKNIAEAVKYNKGADILGVHIEGPFISNKKSGVLPKENTLPCDTKFFDRLSKYGLLLRFTVAPEAENALDFIKYAAKNGCIVTLGHSDDDGSMTQKSIEAGASGFTHLFNAMRGIHHRDGSITKTALLSGLPCEIIADKKHLSVDTLRMIYRIMGIENVVLVTDAMSAMQSETGEYYFCNKNVYYNGETVEYKGILAGSCLTMPKALHNFCEVNGLDEKSTAEAVLKNSLKMIKREDLFEKYL